MALRKTDPRRLRRGFAFGNLVPALVLGVGCWALPLRWWLMDISISVVVLALLVTSAVSLSNERLAPRLLRGAAIALLVLGLALVSAFALSVAFLSGVHGPFGAFGMILMALVVVLLLPYAVIYPCIELWWLHQLREGAAAPIAESAAPESAGVPADGTAA